MKHLIATNDLTLQEIESILDDAKVFSDGRFDRILKDKIIITLFFENSTRTRSSFEIAAKRLGAEIVHLDVANSSTKKGETLVDTAMNLDAMGPHAIIVRHQNSGVPKILSNHTNASIINAGDGAHAHPTQALLDLFTLKKHFGDVRGKKIAIVGDIKNSRVANSNIDLLGRFGMEVILVAPPQFLPKTDLKTTHFLSEVIDEVDAIMSLRTQTERHSSQTYASLKDYASDFCITSEIVGERDIILLHPGPVHRNIDICDALLADKRCKVLEQVSNGVAIRMAVLKKLIYDV
ncbi:MAG: aspartate carbamoyltransferase [Sulfurimonas sp. RIFOXYB2_FULL_37_5]|uniref:aspartate carbamoyltransferase catalytic subunit n=1 Tax=unclassified Sulfurimonas TaxID=2623549 RepID=UPI0008C105BC|nr:MULTISPECIES: aspartate carbamoyltransferase catalytic subunit [unclassified Sulfurimonas]MDO8260573.1 aspartate carbamoyltransferase catalytic subunit [Candidatus Magasanikbacteria bacterium]OHE16199.1 MAG: aspartate carbamoyltransferase [Sulfurimonas sp. RIFOXYB2_FULL_37_5]MBS4067899.1 aspartate carbamoyltransferase catalytic subunit [Sulfurimonas sp.]MDD3856341.1 aspartate carbamoyltransferase catalytic subunit [Sulfurimonas sp.]OHE04345.1 MAG: aspartate carbamoyltransferase [Sulfurimona